MEGLKIDLISDTHTKHDHLKLDGGDILICSGDISYRGTMKEIAPFLDWFSAQNYKHKILIPGNHDFGFEQDFPIFETLCQLRGIILLNDSGVTVEGIKVWGSPITPWFHDWAFNRRSYEIKQHWDLIPEDTEILVTHGPPYEILDLTFHGDRAGCPELLSKVWKTQVKLHVFGHIHEAYGYTYKLDKMFVNASSLDGRYLPISTKPTRVVKGLDGVYLADTDYLNEK